MSHFSEIHVEFTDLDCLLRALETVMPSWKGHIEVHDTAQNLYGYMGDVRPQKAHVIIRKKYVGQSSNDIGFERQMNGTYKAYISEYDEKTRKYDANFVGKLKQAYGAEKVVKEATKNGYKVTKTFAGKNVRLVLVKA
jgi:hypothetical protein